MGLAVADYNENHDPDTGQFSSGEGGGSGGGGVSKEVSKQRVTKSATAVRARKLKAAKVQIAAHSIAKDLGFPVEKLHVAEQGEDFTVGGRKMTAAAVTEARTNEITVYSENLSPDFHELKGVVAHEVQHARYNTVLAELRRETQEVALLPSSHPNAVVNKDGTLVPPYDKQFPTFEMFAQMSTADMQRQLAEKDGVSDYSVAYWDAWANGQGRAGTAVHETLAEIARYDAQGLTDADWPGLAQRPEWVQLYDFVNSTYDRVSGQHVTTPLAPRVSEHSKPREVPA